VLSPANLVVSGGLKQVKEKMGCDKDRQNSAIVVAGWELTASAVMALNTK